MKTFQALLLFLSCYGICVAQDMSVSSPENNTSVEAELKSFKIAKGYKVELYASEEAGIAKPVAMRWDEKGRLWVLCTPLYPQLKPGEKPNDKLIVLEDRDKDGKADHSFVFADSLNVPLGFELGHGGVYLGEQTALLHLKDTNNDGKADVKRIIYSGFGTGDTHQTINSFTWSPGGDLYFAQGLSIYSRVETPQGIVKADRAAIWRYRPTTGVLESFLDRATASDNPWGLAFGHWGEFFIKGNGTDLYYGTPGLAKSAFRSPIPVIGSLEIKGSGAEIIQSGHWPDSLQGDVILAGYYNSKVERMILKEDGAGFKATLVKPLLSSTSRSFRPVEVKLGPDGAIYVLDWYNPIIGHYQASMRHPDRDKTHGRIWRITAIDRPLVQTTQLSNQDIPALLNKLKSNEKWVRYQVRRLLAERETGEVRPALERWISQLSKEDAAYEHHLMEAAAVGESHEWVSKELVQLLMTSKNAGARAFAAHLTGRWNERLQNAMSLLEVLINDEHPRVRLEALVAASYLKDLQAITIAAQVIDHRTDKFIDYALQHTAHGLRAMWEPALQSGSIKFKSDKHLAKLVSLTNPTWYTPDQLLQLVKTEGLEAEGKSILMGFLAKKGTASDLEFILSNASTIEDASILERLAKIESKDLSPASINSLKRILHSKNQEVRIAAIRLVKAWELRQMTAEINSFLKNKRETLNIRGESLEALVQLKGKQALPALKELAGTGETPIKLRLASLQALAALDVNLAAAATMKEMMRNNKSADAMLSVLSPLVDRKGGVQALTAELDKSAVPKDIARLAVKALAMKGLDAPELEKRLTKMSAEQVAVRRSYTPAYLNQLEKEVKQNGNAAKGKAIYQAGSCAGCHKIGNVGGMLGPNLSAIGRGLSPREIIIEVLWPNQNIKEGFEKITVETKKGAIIEGNKVYESNDAVYVKTATSNDNVKINKSEIAKQRSHGSLMPSGLTNSLSEAEVRDLIRYLSDLGNK